MIPSFLLLFSVVISSASANPKLKSLLDKFIVTPEKEAYINSCQSTVLQIQEIERQVGIPTNKETLRPYTEARLNLAAQISSCAMISTKTGSTLQKGQKEALDTMYTSFIAQHKVVDLYGNQYAFDPSSQNVFDESVPLVDSHNLCNPEKMRFIGENISKSWLLTEIQSISEEIKDKTPFPEFQKRLEDDSQKFTAVAKRKSEACLNTKLEGVRVYNERAPQSVRKDWEETVRAEFGQHLADPILKIVFVDPEFKHIKESNTEALPNGDVRTTHQDYYVMDTYVYIANGDYVDGYIVSLYDDKIQSTSYARFYGKDAHGNFQPSHRVLKKNFE